MMRAAFVYLVGLAVWLMMAALFLAAIMQPAAAQVSGTPASCMPAQMRGGTGSAALIRVVDSPIVACARWWCPPVSGAGEWTEATAAFGPTQFAQAKRDEYISAAEKGDAAWLAAHRTWGRTHPEYVRCVDSGDMPARSAAARPAAIAASQAAPAYRVAPNGLTLTRPVYSLTDGVRGTKEVARVAVGVACDPARARSGDYMSFAPDYARDRVALCK